MQEYSIPRQIWRAIYPLLIFFGVSLIVDLGYAIMMFESVPVFSLRNLFAISAICTLIFGLMWRSARTRLPIYSGTKLKIMPAILTVLLFVGLNFIFVAIIGITDLMRHFPPHNLVKQFITSGSLTMRILAVGLFAPVVEELMCRGILLTRLSTWMPTWAAVLVSSALFGFIHLNLLQGMYAFVAGIFFALLYIRYRNLWLPIIAHVAFNLASIILHERLEAMGAEAFSLLLLLISSLLVAVVCALLLKKCTKAAVLIQEPGDGAEASSVIYP